MSRRLPTPVGPTQDNPTPQHLHVLSEAKRAQYRATKRSNADKAHREAIEAWKRHHYLTSERLKVSKRMAEYKPEHKNPLLQRKEHPPNYYKRPKRTAAERRGKAATASHEAEEDVEIFSKRAHYRRYYDRTNPYVSSSDVQPSATRSRSPVPTVDPCARLENVNMRATKFKQGHGKPNTMVVKLSPGKTRARLRKQGKRVAANPFDEEWTQQHSQPGSNPQPSCVRPRSPVPQEPDIDAEVEHILEQEANRKFVQIQTQTSERTGTGLWSQATSRRVRLFDEGEQTSAVHSTKDAYAKFRSLQDGPYAPSCDKKQCHQGYLERALLLYKLVTQSDMAESKLGYDHLAYYEGKQRQLVTSKQTPGMYYTDAGIDLDVPQYAKQLHQSMAAGRNNAGKIRASFHPDHNPAYAQAYESVLESMSIPQKRIFSNSVNQ